MLDTVDKIILAQLGKNARLSSQAYENFFKILEILLQTEE